MPAEIDIANGQDPAPVALTDPTLEGFPSSVGPARRLVPACRIEAPLGVAVRSAAESGAVQYSNVSDPERPLQAFSNVRPAPTTPTDLLGTSDEIAVHQGSASQNNPFGALPDPRETGNLLGLVDRL